MTAMDELRKMLDERGVKWEARTSPRGRIWTYWDAFNGHRVYAMDNENGTVEIFGEWDVTPEQAVEATLGRGTCKEVKIDRYFRGCSECGYIWEHMYAVGWQVGPKFCPNCGAKVVDE